MPIYVYRCEQCGSQFEKRQSFSDAPLTECEKCHGTVHKVLTPAAVIYKGSGFYTTDSGSRSGRNGHNGSNGKGEGDPKPAEAASESKETSKASEGGEKAAAAKKGDE